MQGRFEQALARRPAPDAADGLTTHQGAPMEYSRLLAQHGAYVQCLRDFGVTVTVLPALAGYPDAYFVEDAAVVLGEVAVITRPGAPDRRGEAEAMALALRPLKRLLRIEAPGTLDGGDVLWVADTVFVGRSGRTNDDGIRQLANAAATLNLKVVPVTVPDGLHLKSSVTALSDDTLLMTEEFVPNEVFADFRKVRVPAHEKEAANSLWVKDMILLAAGFPETHRRVEKAGFAVCALGNSEIRKMDGGFSCLSLRW